MGSDCSADGCQPPGKIGTDEEERGAKFEISNFDAIQLTTTFFNDSMEGQSSSEPTAAAAATTSSSASATTNAAVAATGTTSDATNHLSPSNPMLWSPISPQFMFPFNSTMQGRGWFVLF